MPWKACAIQNVLGRVLNALGIMANLATCGLNEQLPVLLSSVVFPVSNLISVNATSSYDFALLHEKEASF